MHWLAWEDGRSLTPRQPSQKTRCSLCVILGQWVSQPTRSILAAVSKHFSQHWPEMLKTWVCITGSSGWERTVPPSCSGSPWTPDGLCWQGSSRFHVCTGKVSFLIALHRVLRKFVTAAGEKDRLLCLRAGEQVPGQLPSDLIFFLKINNLKTEIK